MLQSGAYPILDKRSRYMQNFGLIRPPTENFPSQLPSGAGSMVKQFDSSN
jgi:hypothetical protein